MIGPIDNDMYPGRGRRDMNMHYCYLIFMFIGRHKQLTCRRESLSSGAATCRLRIVAHGSI